MARPPRLGRPAHRRVRRGHHRPRHRGHFGPTPFPYGFCRAHRRRHLGRRRRDLPRTRGRDRRPRAGGRGHRGRPGAPPHLCGRDPQALDADGIARAVVESVAENTSDAVVGALVWGGIAGVLGLLGFRAVNTLDAMVGHKSARYRRYGWASARLDDVAGWPGPVSPPPSRPSRATTHAAPPAPGAPTPASTRAPTPVRWRPLSRAPSVYGWAARSPTVAGSSTGPCSTATDAPPPYRTSRVPYGCPGASACSRSGSVSPGGSS